MLDRASQAMTEQVRAIARQRVVEHAGQVGAGTLASIRQWIFDLLDG